MAYIQEMGMAYIQGNGTGLYSVEMGMIKRLGYNSIALSATPGNIVRKAGTKSRMLTKH